MSSPRKKATKKTATKKKSATRPSKSPAPRADEMPPDVVEFIQAVDRYKRTQGRNFPNLSELLQIVKDLGYSKEAV